MLQFLNTVWIKWAAGAAAILATLGVIFKAGRDSQKVAQNKQESKHRADEAEIRSNVDSMSGNSVRDRLRDKWSKR